MAWVSPSGGHKEIEMGGEKATTGDNTLLMAIWGGGLMITRRVEKLTLIGVIERISTKREWTTKLNEGEDMVELG